MAIELRLTDEDAILGMELLDRYKRGLLIYADSTPRDKGSNGISLADLQKTHDEYWAANGVQKAVEVSTNIEDAQRVLGVDTVAELVAAGGGTDIDTSVVFGQQYPDAGTAPSVAACGTAVQISPVPVVTPAGPPPIVAIPPTLDKDGLPWDQRIHSGSKSMNKDGTWRLKKGLDPAELTRVMAELKGVMAIPVPAAPVQSNLLPLTAAEAGQVPRPPRIEVPAPPAPPGAVPLPPAAAAIPIPPPPAVAQAPNVPAGYTEDPARPGVFLPPSREFGFGEVMFKVAQAVANKVLTQAQVDAVCAEIGLPGLSMLGARPDLIPSIVSKLGLV